MTGAAATAGVPPPQDGESEAEAARTRQWREVGLGAQILKDLGVRSIRLLSSSQHTCVGLGGFGIEITATEPINYHRHDRARRASLPGAPCAE